MMPHYLNKDLKSLEGEVWIDVPGYEGLYEVSSKGRVKTLERGYGHGGGIRQEKILYQRLNKKGYLAVRLSKEAKAREHRVNRVVAQAFVPNPNGLPEVNHIKPIKTCNEVWNLEWCSRLQNMRHAWECGRMGNLLKYARSEKEHITAKRKPVLQYDMDGNFLKEWPSIFSTRLDGFDFTSVSAVCRGRKKNSYKGYVWVFADAKDRPNNR